MELDPIIDSESTNEKKESSTEHSILLLEKEIDTIYTNIESNLTTIWSKTGIDLDSKKKELYSKLETLKKNPILDNFNSLESSLNLNNIKSVDLLSLKASLDNEKLTSLSKSANAALDNLDSHLEQVESKAINYVKSLNVNVNVSSINSFMGSLWNSVVSIEPETPKLEELQETTKSNLFKYGTTRFDQDLYKLHTLKDGYISGVIFDVGKNKDDVSADSSGYDQSDATTPSGSADSSDSIESDDISDFNVDSKTDEISKLLKTYPDLNNLMNELVPIDLSYKLFWYRYFKQFDEIKRVDELRKKLTQENEEEEFDWDDDEEEKEEKKETVKKEEVKEIAEEKNESSNKVDKAPVKDEKSLNLEAEDDEDDDWE